MDSSALTWKQSAMTNKKDQIVGLGTLLFAIVNFVYLMPKFVGKIGRPETIFPIFTTSVLLVLGVLITVSVLLEKPKKEAQVSWKKAISRDTLPGKLLFSMVIAFIYCFFLEAVGFLVLTPICLVATWLVFEVRSWKVLLFTTVILILCIYLLFEFGLRAPLPQWTL